MFKDRTDAAQQLSQRLRHYRGQHPLVLAIPRGAVPIAHVLAAALDGDLDVMLVHKLCAPFEPEVAIGAVDETGRTWLAPHAKTMGATPAYVQAERKRQLQVLRERRLRCSAIRRPISAAGRLVIVVDDGMATGATMMAALQALRGHQPTRLVCAVPVASSGALASVRLLADEVVCLLTPADFRGVGQFYERFEQISDEEVIALLHQRALFSDSTFASGIQAQVHSHSEHLTH